MVPLLMVHFGVLTIFPSGSSSLKSSPFSFDCSVIDFSIVDKYNLHESTCNETYSIAANMVIGWFNLRNYLNNNLLVQD